MPQIIPVEGNPFGGTPPAVQQPSLVPQAGGVFSAPQMPSRRIEVGQDTEEILTAPLEFGQSISGFLGMMATRDPKALQNIISKSIPDAVPGEDQQGNPYVVIKGKPYYMNRPGLSGMDVAGFVGDVIKFLPTGRFAAIAQSGGGRAGMAGLGTLGIETASQSAAQLMGSDQGYDVPGLILTSAFGAAGQKIGDVLSNYVKANRVAFDDNGNPTAGFTEELKKSGVDISEYGKAGKNILANVYASFGNRFAQEAQKATSVARQADVDVFGIPLTKGQRAGDIRQIAQEEAMRNYARGRLAGQRMTEFDAKQRQAIESAATGQAADPFTGQNMPLASTTTEAVGKVFEGLKLSKEAAKTAAGEAYGKVNMQDLLFPVSIQQRAIASFRNAIQEGDITLGEKTTPAALEAINRLEQLVPSSGKAKITDISLKQVEQTRRQLLAIYKGASNDADRMAVSKVISSLDDAADDAINNSLIKGDEAMLGALKDARKLYKSYRMQFPAKGGEANDADRVLRRILDETQPVTSVEIANLLFGKANIGQSQTSVRVVDKLQQIYKETPERFAELQQAAYLRTILDQNGNIRQPSQIVRNIDVLLTGEGKELAGKLFNADQLATLREFKNAVSKTIVPQEAKNPSKTGYEVARLGEDVLRTFGLGGAVSSAASGDVLPAAAGGALALSRQIRPYLQARAATAPAVAPTPPPSIASALSAASGKSLFELTRERRRSLLD